MNLKKPKTRDPSYAAWLGKLASQRDFAEVLDEPKMSEVHGREHR